MLRQTVQPYASSTARDAALAAVLKEGMVAYLEDSNAVTVYDGSSWSTLGGGGGGVVNAVTAGTNLNGGGSSATVTLNLDTTLTGLSSVTSTSVVGALTGNASTATALQTARTIGGVSFDGTGNINLPGVNTAGNQATSGLAATATALATARAINGVNFDGTAAITVTAAAGTLTGGTLNSGVTASSLTSIGTLAAQLKVVSSSSEQIRLQNTTSATVGPYIALWHSTARIGYIGFPNNDDLHLKNESAAGRIYLSTNNTTRMTVTDAGYVGIGTTGPVSNLHVVGSARASTGFYVGASGDDGIGPVTGQFGNVQTVGSGVGNYEGYSISGRAVFMHDGTTVTGIYNDVDNQWFAIWVNNGYTRIYDSDGIAAFGANDYTSGGTGAGGNGYVGVSNYCGGFSGTTAVMTSTTVAGVAMKRLGFSSSSYEFKSGIEDLVMSDEAFMSLKPITFHPNDQYVDLTGDVTEIPGGHTLVPDSVEAGETAGLMPLKRAGFGLEDLYGREDTMILATEYSPDPTALIALLTLKLQETMTRVDALETAA